VDYELIFVIRSSYMMMQGVLENDAGEFVQVVGEMTASVSSVREVIRSMLEKCVYRVYDIASRSM
jgi:hypothetical protein